MKRVVLLIMLTLILTGCGKKGKPADMPQDVYDVGIDALKVVNNYLNDEADIEETFDLFDRITEDFLMDTENYEKLNTDAKLSSLGVSSTLVKMSLKLQSIKNSWFVATDISADKKELKKLRDDLKSKLGE